MYAVLDPEPEIRGGGGGGKAQYPKNFFWPFGPQFGLKIGGGVGGSHPGPSTTDAYIPNLNYKYGHFPFWGVGHTPVSIQPYFTHNCMSFWPFHLVFCCCCLS